MWYFNFGRDYQLSLKIQQTRIKFSDNELSAGNSVGELVSLISKNIACLHPIAQQLDALSELHYLTIKFLGFCGLNHMCFWYWACDGIWLACCHLTVVAIKDERSGSKTTTAASYVFIHPIKAQGSVNGCKNLKRKTDKIQ